MSPENIIAALGLERIATAPGFIGDIKAGTLVNAQGSRVATLPESLLRSLHFVVERQRTGAWAPLMHQCGVACGRGFGAAIDRRLGALSGSRLATLPLDVAVDVLVRLFALHAWGVLQVDTSDVEAHAIVLAHVEHDFVVAAQNGTGERNDPFCAGVLQGYFEHLTGQALRCAELTCAGAAKCTFVVTTPDRLNPLQHLLGREPAAAVLAQLKK